MKENDMSEKPQITEKDEKSVSKQGRAAWFAGAVLIIVGMAFIVENLDLPFIKQENWWAMFLLIPIVAILDDIYRIYTTTTEGKAGAIASKGVGLFVLGVIMVIFLFGFNLGIYWPVLLIVAGVVFLLAAIIK
jgi:hypothetical protein